MSETNENSSKDEMIGFHKGALSTLSKEYQELAKILGIVQQLMQAHIQELEKLGVKIETQTPEIQKDSSGNAESQKTSAEFKSGWEKEPLEKELK